MNPKDFRSTNDTGRPPLSLPLSIDSWVDYWYPWIVDFLNISPKRDYEVINQFIDQLPKTSLAKSNSFNLDDLVTNRSVIICGCGPSLEADLRILPEKLSLFKNPVIISADGATLPLLTYNFLPNIVVTDADGDHQSIISANRQGSVVICHLHGDNLNDLIKLYSQLNPLLTGLSVQTKPVSYFNNHLGFTDGDRACFLAAHFKCRAICLIGFDLGEYVGKYSKPSFEGSQPATSFKRRKLIIARELLSWLANQAPIPLVNSSQWSEKIPLVPAIPLQRLAHFPP